MGPMKLKRFKLPTIFWSLNFVSPLLLIICGLPMFYWALFPHMTAGEFVDRNANLSDQWFFLTFYWYMWAICIAALPGGIWMLAYYYKQDLPSYLKDREFNAWMKLRKQKLAAGCGEV
jgi:hypothetical protein